MFKSYSNILGLVKLEEICTLLKKVKYFFSRQFAQS